VADLIGQQIGPYQIIDKLGAGGMAIVYRAHDSKLNREVAMKIIKGDLASNADFIRRFEREARTIAALSHPHILKVFDFGQYEENVYLIIELMTGGSLSDSIRSGKQFSGADALHVLDQIGRALDYAHRQGIVHRDLKPQNVLLDNDGNAYLTDFGIAKLLQTDTNLTATGMVMGTPAYMSPEQWSGQGVVDGRADIYALGVILYEMLAGGVPFDGDTPFRLMHQHIYEPPRPIKPLRPDLPDGIQVVLNRALAKSRDDRYSSASELLIDLRAALDGKIAAPPLATIEGATANLPVTKGTTPPPTRPPISPTNDLTGQTIPPAPATGSTGNRRGLLMGSAALVMIALLAGAILLNRPGATGVTTPTINLTNGVTPTAPEVAIVPSATIANTASSLPPTASSAPPTSTRVPPSATNTTIPPTINDQATLDAFIAATSGAFERATLIARTIDARFTQTQRARPTLTPTPTNTRTNTSIPPTNTATATLRPPTSTAIPPTVTPTVTPTNTPVPPTPTLSAPPIGGGKNKLVFFSSRRNTNDLYIMNTDGSDVQPLTITEGPSPENGNVNVWPDGSRIIFASNRSGDFQIWTMNTDGSNPQQLTKGNPLNLNPVPSPDGKKIAFVSTRDGGDHELYVMDADGSNQTRLTFSAGFDTEPTWFPDSSAIMFMSGRTGTFQIFVINADGTRERRLFSSRFNESSPALSPDGKTLAWHSDRTGSREIFTGNAATPNQNPTRLTNTEPGTLNAWANWSPDGKHLTFISNRDGNTEIYIIGADGKDERRITGSPAADGDAGAKWLP
jgi:serine/threonine protein kinase/Tol biopolymer transport system component